MYTTYVLREVEWKLKKVMNKICFRLVILFLCFLLIGIIPYNGNAFSKNTQHELGVYTLYDYGFIPGTSQPWKVNVKPYPDNEDPYNDFWFRMTEGVSPEYAEITSNRYLNSEINYGNVFPVVFDFFTKDWDDYDLVFFYGHNNMIKPPHPSENWELWTNNNGDGTVWESYEAFLPDWGTPDCPMEYYYYDITNADRYPGSVTYLHEPFTSALIGGRYHFGESFFIFWWVQTKCQDTPQRNTKNRVPCFGHLGTKDLDWLILHGCQGVIVCDETGRNPLSIGIDAFKKTYGGFHIILGHYTPFTTGEISDLTPFANDLLSGMPVQGAYFLTEPQNKVSAIAPLAIPKLLYPLLLLKYGSREAVFEQFAKVFGTYMSNDTWLEPMSNSWLLLGFKVNMNYHNSVIQWQTANIHPLDLENDKQIKEEKQSLSGKEISFHYLDIYDDEIIQFLGSDKLYVRPKNYTLDTGMYPILMLEQITKNDVEGLMQQNILQFSKLTIKKEQIKDFTNFLSARVGDTIYWVEKASGGYSIQDVERMMVNPSTIAAPQEAVHIALKHLVDLKLVELGEEESLNLLFVSNVKKAAFYDGEDEPCYDYPSDYLVGFGREYKGIPVIGSNLVLRLGKDGELLGIRKNWRTIVGEAPLMLKVDDSKLKELLTAKLISHGVIKNTEDIDKIEIISMACGYFEGLLSKIQEQMGLGCLVNYRHQGDDMILHIVFPIADSDFSLLGED